MSNPEFYCRGSGVDLSCAGDVADPALDGSASAGEFIGKLSNVFLLAFWIHLSLFVGELAMLRSGTGKEARKTVDGFAHILTMPITIISFYQGDTIGTILFFGSLWHFLCDSAGTRPTYVLLVPGFGGRTKPVHFLRWFESLWITTHHVAIGTVKLAIDSGVVAKPSKPLGPILLLLFIVGAGLAHLSFGMAAFGIKGSVQLLVVSQVLRVGADVAMVLYERANSHAADWAVLMFADFVWVLVMLAVRALNALLNRCAEKPLTLRAGVVQRGHFAYGADEAEGAIQMKSLLSSNCTDADVCLVKLVSKVAPGDTPPSQNV